MKARDPIPVTVLTGFLGAGKTTLLNHLVNSQHGYRCAIIINEFGAVSIDNQLVMGAEEEIVELNNGCLCCRVRGDLVKSLGKLLRNPKKFDYILIETTGLADPGPVAYTFGTTDLRDSLRLDGIVTVVDARHIQKELNDAPEASAQIAFADVILLNKTDLVSPAQLEAIERRIRAMNALARIHRTQRSVIDLGNVLNIRARELSSPVVPQSVQPAPATAAHDHGDHAGHTHAPGAPCTPECDHDHDHDHDHAHGEGDKHDHGHDHTHEHGDGHECGPGCEHGPEPGREEAQHADGVGSIVLRETRALDLGKTEKWLTEVLNVLGEDIYRCKGILYIRGQAKRTVFQGVQMMFEAAPDRLWNPGEPRESVLVFIGRELEEGLIRQGFADCVAAE